MSQPEIKSRLYRIQAQSWVFYANVFKDIKENDADKDTYIVHIGSKKRKGCITINVYKDDPIAHLQSIDHDTRCSSNKPMPNKTGTRAMLNAAIHFLKYRFNYVEHLSLEDTSSFKCAKNPVNTSDMSFILHGKTWYERYFDAVPYERKAYRNLFKVFTSAAQKTFPFSVVWKEILFITKLPEDELKHMYESSATYQEFFIKIYTQYMCVPFHPMTTVVNIFKLFSKKLPTLNLSMWYIPIDKRIANEPNDAYKIKKLHKEADYPAIKWEEPKVLYNRIYKGGRRKMYLGDDFD